MRQKAQNLAATMDLRSTLRTYLTLTLGAVLLALAVAIFLAPANISPGGVMGIAIIINQFTGWPVGTTMLVLNIPMLFIGFRYLGRFRFLSRTLYVVILYNLGVDFLTAWLPPNGITDDLLLNALYSAAVGGVGSGLIYRGHGTPAGTGVLGRYLQLRTGIPLSQIYLITDGGVIIALGLTFGWERALYSLFSLFVWGLVTDYALEGPSVIRTAFVVTDQAEAITHALFNRLGIGVTSWTGRGMFTEAQHTILFCTLNRPDVSSFQSVVTGVDPEAFVVIGQGHHAKGGVLKHLQQQAKSRGMVKKPV